MSICDLRNYYFHTGPKFFSCVNIMPLGRPAGRGGIITIKKSIFIALCCLSMQAVFAAEQLRSVPVQVVEAVEVEIAPTTWVPATVIGRDDSRLAAEVSGRLEDVLEVGDRVEKGDIIAHIESTTFELRVAEAEAEIIPLAAKLDFYRRESNRLEVLARKNNAAKNRLDEVSSNYNEYTGRLKVAKTRLALDLDQLQRTVVKAPFAGVIMHRYHTKGERVDVGDLIVRLVNTESLEIQAWVPASSIPYLNPGKELRVSDNKFEQTATVRVLVPVGDDISRLYELRLNFENPDWTVGYAVRVAVPMSNKRKILAVPRDAIVLRPNDIKVFKINADGVAESITVELGIAQDNLIEIIGDIRPGDVVVIRGNERLRDGQKVLLQAGVSLQ